MIPAGAVPLGAFVETFVTPGALAVPILADYTDPLTGDTPLANLLSTRTPVDGAIIEGLRVERGSGPAVQLVGNTLRQIRNTDPTSLSETKGRTRDGLLILEQQGLAKLITAAATLGDRGDAITMDATIRDFTVQGKPEDRTYAVSRGAPV
jgi:hypothetical protein